MPIQFPKATPTKQVDSKPLPTIAQLQTPGSDIPASLPTGDMIKSALTEHSSVSKSLQPSIIFTFDQVALQAHLDKVIEFQNTFSGKHGHNPFLWIRKNVEPLYCRMMGIDYESGLTQDSRGYDIKPEVSESLSNAIMALPLDEAPSAVNLAKKKK